MSSPDVSPGEGCGGILLIASEMDPCLLVSNNKNLMQAEPGDPESENCSSEPFICTLFFSAIGDSQEHLWDLNLQPVMESGRGTRLQQQPWLGLLAGLPCFRAVPAAVVPSQKGPFMASQSKVRLTPGMHTTVQSLMLFSSRIPTRLYSYQHYWFLSLWGASDGLSSPGYKQSHTEPPKLP